MTIFGEYLRQILDINKITVYSLAKQTRLERTAIHRFMTNKKPSLDFVIPNDYHFFYNELLSCYRL